MERVWRIVPIFWGGGEGVRREREGGKGGKDLRETFGSFFLDNNMCYELDSEKKQADITVVAVVVGELLSSDFDCAYLI